MFSLEWLEVKVEKSGVGTDWLVKVEAMTSLQEGKLLGFVKLRNEEIEDLPYCLQDVVGKMMDKIKMSEAN